MRSVQVDIASIENNMIDINTSVAGKLNFSSNGTLIMPVQGAAYLQEPGHIRMVVFT